MEHAEQRGDGGQRHQPRVRVEEEEALRPRDLQEPVDLQAREGEEAARGDGQYPGGDQVRVEVALDAARAGVRAEPPERGEEERSRHERAGDRRPRGHREAAGPLARPRGERQSRERHQQHPRQVQLHDPAHAESHERGGQREAEKAGAGGGEGLQEAEEEEDAAGQHVRGVHHVRGVVKRPGRRQRPSEDEPGGQRGQPPAHVRAQQRERGGGEQVEQHERRLRHRDHVHGQAHQQALQRAGDLAPRPHDVGTEVGPRARGVMAHADQEDLGLVLEPEVMAEPEGKAAGEGGGQRHRPRDRPSPPWLHRVRRV